MTFPQPSAFFSLRVTDLASTPGLSGLCVGYERGAWRTADLVKHVMEWLPEFALSASECKKIGHHNAVEMVRAAARRVYTTGKFKKRGEFGEILLHAAIRGQFDSFPAVSKIYYKSADNDTVKGFDAVHIVGPASAPELWLGEVKFYQHIGQAIKDVCVELATHFETDYLRREFALVTDKIDPESPHAATMSMLLRPQVSLDEVFKRVCVPVLLTYDSNCIGSHTVVDEAYELAFEQEVRAHWMTFAGKLPKLEVRVHLLLLPMKSKKELVAALDAKLKIWREI